MTTTVAPREVFTLVATLIRGDFTGNEADWIWKRTFDITSDATLLDLHYLLQELLEFDDDHMWDFRIGSSPRRRDRVFQYDEHSLYDHCETVETPLSAIFPLDRKMLYYVFDYGPSWTVELRKIGRAKKPDEHVTYPVLIHSQGETPKQYPYEES